MQNLFKIAKNRHTHHTRNAARQQITLPQVRTTNYGLNSVTYKAAKDWSSVQKIVNFNFLDDNLSSKKLLNHLKKIYIYKKKTTSFTVSLI